MDAALACILELGFYRASTNEIARRAGMTWGSIQYHFGSREALLVAVVTELNRRFASTLADIKISGSTVEERLASLYKGLAREYGEPAYLAKLQITLNLLHDPDTEHDVEHLTSGEADLTTNEMRRVLGETLGPHVSRTTATTVFAAMRGMALSSQLLDHAPATKQGVRTKADRKKELRVFLEGVAAMARTDPNLMP